MIDLSDYIWSFEWVSLRLSQRRPQLHVRIHGLVLLLHIVQRSDDLCGALFSDETEQRWLLSVYRHWDNWYIRLSTCSIFFPSSSRPIRPWCLTNSTPRSGRQANHGNPALWDCCDWPSGSLVNPEAKRFTKRKQTIHHTPPEKKEPRRTHKRKAPVGYLR